MMPQTDLSQYASALQHTRIMVVLEASVSSVGTEIIWTNVSGKKTGEVLKILEDTVTCSNRSCGRSNSVK
ncbi:hypothetical protein DPX16_0547 [Anabarilius grahami]|uniref:Uncharacterized protein n=1 Tax=Anabarilius grahami TaxID=495550 RepID=A0A3N0YIV2_ANAGA|nr:hypothetical protein DPX16_0547 [Anabarilius grahami]